MESIASESSFAGHSRYRIEAQIGAGGGGRVFKAWDEKLQRAVALKRIEKAALADGRSAAQEALHLSSLHHPNIVTVFDFEEDAEGPFVVLEYVEGETLGEVVRRGAFPLEEFSRLAQQSLDALGAAHALGLLHRDLKPDNFMVQWLPNDGFQVKLLDFGLAKIVAVPQAATCQHDGTYLGTIYTMAPEALQKAPVDVRSDLYSLGCVFYYALTQQMPFTGATISDVVVSHLQHQVVPLEQYRPDLPPMIAQWVQQFIEVDPSQRFHSANQALAVFARLLQSRREETAATPAAPAARAEASTSPASKPGRSIPWSAWATGLIVIGALTVWVRGKPDPSPPAETVMTAASAPVPAATPKPSVSGLPDAAAIASSTQTSPLSGSSPVADTAPLPAPPAPVLLAAAATPRPIPPTPGKNPAAPATAVPTAPPVPATPAPAPTAEVLQATDLEGVRARLGTEVVVEGTVVNLSANKTGEIRYLNFDRNFRNAVSLVFFANRVPEFTEEALQTYVSKRIRVRGVVEQYKENLQIKVQALSQLEVVP